MVNTDGLSCEVWIKICLWAMAIVAALFCAILEAGVTSGVIPYTAFYM
jgi:hypothetical protein